VCVCVCVFVCVCKCVYMHVCVQACVRVYPPALKPKPNGAGLAPGNASGSFTILEACAFATKLGNLKIPNLAACKPCPVL